MLIRLGETQINLDNVEYNESSASKHTGNELERFSFTIRAKGNKKEMLDEVITNSKNGGVFAVDNTGGTQKEYKITNHSYSYNGNFTDEETIYTYSLELEQIEKLEIKQLVIAGIKLSPYKYSEEYDNGIIINTCVRLSNEENEQIKNAIGKNIYFEVIREGISQEPKTMRFGKTIWSEDGEFTKESWVLVENIYDEKTPKLHHWNEPEWSNIQIELAIQKHINKSLLNLLMSKGIITSHDIDKLTTEAKDNYREFLKYFLKVDDIDTF